MSKIAIGVGISITLIIALLFCPLQNHNISSPASIDDRGITTTVTTDEQSYLPGEVVLINITLTNTNTTNIELWNACWPVFHLYILDENGSTVYWEPQIVFLVICNETLCPGESSYFEVPWEIPVNQSYGNYTVWANAYDSEYESCQFLISDIPIPEPSILILVSIMMITFLLINRRRIRGTSFDYLGNLRKREQTLKKS